MANQKTNTKNSIKYEFLEHPADLKIKAYGKNLPELFINAALGMTQFLFGKDKTKTSQTETIKVEAEDLESLLVNWLSEVLYLTDTNRRMYCNYNFKVFSENKIIAEISSGKEIKEDDIKAATYHELKITQHKDNWTATIVFDI